MQCPACQIALQMTERSGVEIDYCPRCRGVWLDRGELDKIIERAAQADVRIADARSTDRDDDRRSAPRRDDDHRRDPDRDHDHRYPHKSRKRSFLGELFDFD